MYSYDAGGNILSRTHYPYSTSTDLTSITPTQTDSYGYDSTWKDLLTSYDGKTLSYDNIGNLTNDGTYSYTWEMGRQLKTISGNGNNISYNYDDNGIRTEKTVNGVTTNYHLVGDKVTYETNGTDTIYYTYDSNNKLVSMNLNGVEYYYVRDGQGDIIGLLDNTGTQVVTYSYDSWGVLKSIGGSLKDTVGVKNPYRYRGYRYDTETGLYYLQSRYYNPDWGRFINADSTGTLTASPTELTDKNLFSYCDNNPTIRSDESGFFWNFVAGALIGGAIGAGFEIADELSHGKKISLKKVGIQFVSGAASGLVAASGIGLAGAIGINGLISGVTSVASDLVDGTKSIKHLAENASYNVAWGGLGGLVGGEGANYGSKISAKTIIRMEPYFETTTSTFSRYMAKKIAAIEFRKSMVKTIKFSFFQRAFNSSNAR